MSATRVRSGQGGLSRADAVLLGAALLGVVAFVLLLPGQHPDRAAHYRLGPEAAEAAAEAFLARKGYAVDGLQAQVALQRNPDLLVAFQDSLGRPDAGALLASEAIERMPAYNWRVWYRPANANEGGPAYRYALSLTLEGTVWAFSNPPRRTPSGNFLDRNALQAAPALASSDPEDGRFYLDAVPDSVLERDLRFNFRNLVLDSTAFAFVPDASSAGMLYRFVLGQSDAAAIAGYHLAHTALPGAHFRVDSVWALPESALRAARVRFATVTPVEGQHLQASVEVAATGTLLDLRVTFAEPPSEGLAAWLPAAAEALRWATIALLVLILFISFFRRLVARLVDVKAALVDAAVISVFFGGFFALTRGVMNAGEGGVLMEVLGRLLMMSVLAGVTSLLFFMLSGALDSLTRTVWSKKLHTTSLLRQGKFRNLYVGAALLRGVGLAGVLLGVLVLFLLVFPGARLEPGQAFVPDLTYQPFVWEVFYAGWMAYLLVMLVVLGVGTFAYQFRQSPWMMAGAVAGVMMIVMAAPLPLAPVWYRWACSALVGLVLAWSMWEYDLLVTFIGLFLTYLLVGLSEGALVDGSPMWVDTLLGVLLVPGMLILGFIGVRSGRSGREVAEYVPSYLEDMAQEERVQRELEIARQVQVSFLPRTMPDVPGIDLAAMCLPAQEVGGDYYDFVELGPGQLAVVVGDVSGKGIPAAFYMTLTKGILQTLCREVRSPAEVLRRLNTLFCHNATSGTFISMIYGVFDVPARTFTFARAGHNPLILKRSPSHQAEMIRPPGMAIGLSSGPRFDETIVETTLHLRTGDVLVFYTDGFSEAMNQGRKQYGDDRLAGKVGSLSRRSANGILRSVTEDVHHFIEGVGRLDDMTMVVLKYIGPAEGRVEVALAEAAEAAEATGAQHQASRPAKLVPAAPPVPADS